MQLVIWHMRLPQLLVYRYVQLQILGHLNHSSGSGFRKDEMEYLPLHSIFTVPDLVYSTPLVTHIRQERSDYYPRVRMVRAHLTAGDTYQVNLTLKADTRTTLNSLQLFQRLYTTQPVPYAAFICTEDFDVLSLSPELFLNRSGNLLTSKPMKGTLPRGKLLHDDEVQKIRNSDE